MIKALIPARGGSKGISNKNMVLFDGKPLIFYTINEVLKILSPENIYLSSDSDEILNYGKKFNINLIKRPNKISGDQSTSTDVIKHFIQKIELQDKNDYTILYLQPTSPLRKSFHIEESLSMFKDNSCDSLISVARSKELPNKTYIMNKKRRLEKMINSQNQSELRQKLPDSYYPNGAIYIFNKYSFLKEESIPKKNILPYNMSQKYSIDIDTEIDLKIAEFLSLNSIK
ncbi:MAG: acylneuraminate cytidylyltransferase [Gammaproteobacteria bacterium]|nr:acylneuraminate cytidylyltransferase [Gammaproteobacteria bacterium]|tara:strand:+ start:955 stop:1641 length:687 start_codon:yes stop_codon:yes gene_type:complete